VRADRLLSLLLLLQTRRSVKAEELARRLEVSRRTIYRDVGALSQAGVPVYAETGPRGGIRMLSEYRTDLTGLSRDEALALSTLSSVPSLRPLGLDAALTTAMAKVAASLPAAHQIAAEHQRQRLHIDSGPWFAGGEDVRHVSVIRDAVWQDRKLQLHYRNRDGRRSRMVVSPYGLVVKSDRWYLVAEVRGGLRVFRVSRVIGARALEERFTRKAHFDLEKTWSEWHRRFVSNLPRYEVMLRCSAEVERELRETGFAWRRVDSADSTLVFDFQREAMALRVLLPLGRSVVVLAPGALKQRLREIAAELVTMYSRLDADFSNAPPNRYRRERTSRSGAPGA
jgi:predicted DNA-binding transcriptional regulator YafY